MSISNKASWSHMCLIDQSPHSISAQEIAKLLQINILFETDLSETET